MKADYNRYKAEFTTGNYYNVILIIPIFIKGQVQKKSAETAKKAYLDALEKAKHD